MRSRILLVAFCMLVPVIGLAQGGSNAPPIEGVWRITRIVTTGANAATTAAPQPSLVIFARGHYSYLSVNSSQPRPDVAPAKVPNKLTDAEKLARYEMWNPFTAQSGTYEIKGSSLTRRPVVAKNVNVMTTNPPIVQEFTVQGDTLVLVTKSAAGQPTSETRTTLTRVR